MRKKIIISVLAILNLASYADTVKFKEKQIAKSNFERQERIREEEKIQKLLIQESKRKSENLVPTLKDLGGDKFFVKEVELLDVFAITKDKQKQIISKYINRKIGLSDIYNLVGDLTNEYIKMGYTTTKVSIVLDQKLDTQVLKLKIIPGKIEKISMGNMTSKEKLALKTAFPVKGGELLNLFKLEQGILNLNTSVYNNAKMKIIPGQKLGDSLVSIQNKRKFSGLNLNFNNSGQENSGKEKVKLSLAIGDLFVNDNFSMSFDKNLYGNRENKFTKSFDFSYEIPYKFWKFGVSTNYSKYLTTVAGVVSPIKFSGNTRQTSYKIERTIGKIGRGKLKFETSLNLKAKRDFATDRSIDISSRNTTNSKNKLMYVGKLKGGSIYGDLTYTFGLNKLGATKDIVTTDDAPRSDFGKYNLNIRWIKPFNYKKQFLTYEFSFGSQYSEDLLYEQDKFSVGDSVSVRGYQVGASGENGYYLKNQLSYNLGSLVVGKPANKYSTFISKITVFAGIDYGMVRSKENKTNDTLLRNEELLGMGTGIKYLGDSLNWELAYFKGLHAPDYIEKDDIFYFNVSLGFN